MRARAPGSSANLGPGFDVLALALARYVEVEIVDASRLEIHAEGEGADFPQDESHLAARVATSVLGHDRFRLAVRSQIPVGRGLGSSAALAVATAASAGAADPLGVAVDFEGHAENAAASVLGGLVAATVDSRGPIARTLPLDAGLSFVVLIPDRHLQTSAARAALGAEVARRDAVFNLGRMGLLVAGLGDRSQLCAAAGEDRLHQDGRTALFPEAPELMDQLRRAGATIACWSGAGPSLLGICDGADVAARVRDAGEAALGAVGVSGVASVVEPDLEGLVVCA